MEKQVRQVLTPTQLAKMKTTHQKWTVGLLHNSTPILCMTKKVINSIIKICNILGSGVSFKKLFFL